MAGFFGPGTPLPNTDEHELGHAWGCWKLGVHFYWQHVPRTQKSFCVRESLSSHKLAVTQLCGVIAGGGDSAEDLADAVSLLNGDQRKIDKAWVDARRCMAGYTPAKARRKAGL